MSTLDLDLALTVREDPQDGYLATLYGRAVPYDTPTRVGGVEERFDREAFIPADVIGKPVTWRHQDPIGVITGASNTDDGLYVTAGILDTAQGRDAAILVRAGAVKGLSVEFTPTRSTWNRARTAVAHAAAAFAGVALTHIPAYPTAAVTAVREEGTPMEDTAQDTAAPVVSADLEAREAIAQLRSQLDAVVHTAEPVHPLAQYRSLGEYVKAAVRGDVDGRALNVSALSEQTGMVPPTWLMDVKGLIENGQQCISAIGGPQGAGDTGMTITWPTFSGDLTAIVAAQANEGDEVNSADIDIVSATATLATYATANKLTRQVIERSAPSYVSWHMRILAAAFGLKTDYAFQNALWANDTYGGVDYDFSADTTGSAFCEAVWNAAIACEDATGAPPDVVYANTAIYKKLAAWTSFQSQNYPIQNTSGAFSGTTLRASVFGLPIVRAREFAVDESEDAIVTNRLAVGWAQDGPRVMTADSAATISQDKAIYGYGVTLPFISAGIVSIYNHA